MAFTLSGEQFAAFEGVAQDQWAAATARRLHQAYAAHYISMGATPEALVPLVTSVISWARRFSVTGQADVTRLCHVAACLGHRFWQDPRFRGYVAVSMGQSVPHSRRAQAMTRETKAWLETLWRADSLSEFSLRLAQQVAAGHGPDAATLHAVLPGHWQLFSTSDSVQLRDWLVNSAPLQVQGTAPQQLAHAACALVHGANWINDPQYPRLSDTVRTVSDPAILAETLGAIYAEATV